MTYLPVDEYGRIRLDALKEALCDETILVSVMYVNNEVGSVQPIAEASAIVKAYNKNILFHVDAVQGFGKYKIYPKKMGIDMLSVSGHKIHGPKGIGFIYINEKAKVKTDHFRRRAAEKHAFRNRKCTGDCRNRAGSKDDLHRPG